MVFQVASWFSLFLVGFHGFSRWFDGFSWFLVGFHDFSRWFDGLSWFSMVFYDTKQVLSIDPEKEAVEMLGTEMEGRFNYQAGGVMASNGKIYFAPYDAKQVLSIDPEKEAVEMLGTEMEGRFNYQAGG